MAETIDLADQYDELFAVTNPGDHPMRLRCVSGTEFVQGAPIYATEYDEWCGDGEPPAPGTLLGYERVAVVTMLDVGPRETVTLPEGTRYVTAVSIISGQEKRLGGLSL